MFPPDFAPHTSVVTPAPVKRKTGETNRYPDKQILVDEQVIHGIRSQHCLLLSM